MKQTVALTEHLREFSMVAHLDAQFACLFGDIKKPDPIDADEAVEGIVAMPEETP